MRASYEELEEIFSILIGSAIDEGNHILKAVRLDLTKLKQTIFTRFAMLTNQLEGM